MKATRGADHSLFSKNELATIRLICKGLSNREISEKLEKSVRTIDGYRESILVKMKVHNTAGLVVYAIKKGIFKV
jgi:DNA-binding NarL/FixJ family response regulator